LRPWIVQFVPTVATVEDDDTFKPFMNQTATSARRGVVPEHVRLTIAVEVAGFVHEPCNDFVIVG
jgi:hypothetical protein